MSEFSTILSERRSCLCCQRTAFEILAGCGGKNVKYFRLLHTLPCKSNNICYPSPRATLKVNEYTLKGSNSALSILDYLQNGSLLLKERKFSSRRKFLHLREDPILKGFNCPGEKTGNHKSCFPLQKWWKTWRCTHTP